MSKQLSLLILAILVFILVGGCTGAQVAQPTPLIIYVTVTPEPTPTPTPTPEPTATPTPTPTPIPVDNIVGLWETYYHSVYGSIEFFQNGTCIINEGGLIYPGLWKKTDDTHYVIDTSVKDPGKVHSTPIILNNDMNTLYFGDEGIAFTKKTTSSPTPGPIVTPVPTPTGTPADDIIGLWEGYKNSVNYSLEFFQDETLVYNRGGNLATGWWEKIDNKQYKLTILSSITVITLNSNMSQFSFEKDGIIFVKKT